MKTFLRTSLFRIVAAIAFLTVSGFGYNDRKISPVFSQAYLAQWIPTSLQTQIADKAVSDYQHADTRTEDTTPTDPALEIPTDGASNATTLPATFPQNFAQPDLTDLKVDIAGLSQQITDQLNQLYSLLSQQIQQATTSPVSTSETPEVAVDANAQKKAELQAQIDQLQSAMSSL